MLNTPPMMMKPPYYRLSPNKRPISVWNLNTCPEDAVIGLDLFDELDFIEAVKLGISLAKQGYDDVDFTDTTGLYHHR